MSNVIIIGAGRGLLFADIIGRDEFQTAGHTVAAIVEPRREAHGKLRRELNRYHLPQTAICNSAEEALERFSPEEAPAVFIVTPTVTHLPLLRLALKHRRHILLEKPVAANWDDAAEIARLAADTDRIIQLGFVLHYSPFYREAQRIAASGALGKIVNMQLTIRRNTDTEFLRSWRRRTIDSGGLLNEKSSHDFDIIRLLKRAQSEPEKIVSFAGRELFPRDTSKPERCSLCADDACPFRFHPEKYDHAEYTLLVDQDAFDRCVYRTDSDLYTDQGVMISFRDGTHAVFQLTALSGDEDRTLILHGTDGYLAGSLRRGSLTLTTYRDGKVTEFTPCVASHDMHGGGDFQIVREFFECIASGRKPAATVLDGVLASRLAFAADLSVQTGRVVKLDELSLTGVN